MKGGKDHALQTKGKPDCYFFKEFIFFSNKPVEHSSKEILSDDLNKDFTTVIFKVFVMLLLGIRSKSSIYLSLPAER